MLIRCETTFRSSSPIWSAGCIALWSMILIGPAIGQTTSDESIPLWRTGVSTFNGRGYEYPPIEKTATVPAKVAVAPVVSDQPRYTVPLDPGRATPINPYYTNDFGAIVPAAPSTSLDDTSSTATVSGEVSSLPMPLRNRLPPASSSDIDDASIGEVLDLADDGTGIDVAPLENEIVRWYQYPMRWMKGWNSHAELGLDGSSGNAETLAIQTGLETKRKTDIYTFAIDFDYRQASSRKVTTEDNGRLNIDYDRILGGSPWSLFAKSGLEWDKFKAFDLRVNMNAGLGYHWIRTDDASFVTRFGAGASKEYGAPDDDWTPEAVFGLDAERQLTKRQKLKGKIDYFPAWEDFNDYRIVADASWEVLLDGSDNLSLKVSATDRYDSTPQGAKPNDVYYSLLLLYKF